MSGTVPTEIVPPKNFSITRWIVAVVIIALFALASLAFIPEPRLARASIVAAVCLTLWLSEVVPPYVPTVVFWALTPILLQSVGEEFRFAQVLGWSADPVLALFLGGFTLSVAASRYGLDARVAHFAIVISQGRRLVLLALIVASTAILSMWMSNIAAAAMMIVALRPLFSEMARDAPFRRALLMGVAIGANFGGIATPVGTGPNAIAIAAVSRHHDVTFLSWMAFALPLTVLMLIAGIVFVVLRFRVRGTAKLTDSEPPEFGWGSKGVLIILLATIAAWLTEPLHGVPAGIVALLSVVALFGSGLLDRKDLNSIDWSTLALIAGGIGLGSLLEKSGVVKAVSSMIPWAQAAPLTRLLVVCFLSALLSALMSNTATAAMLIPLAGSIDPSPSTAILIAIAASMGIPFVISTPPNAMVYGEGVRSSDLLVPGLILMILGCLLVALTGPFVMRLMGIP
jgi:solute carrier family 13 (sodium-dependent dicarboxylate transporter), member 2/3/5